MSESTSEESEERYPPVVTYRWNRSTSVAAIAVVLAGCISRLPKFDLGWFGWDQAYFLAEARQVANGNFDIVGPLVAGRNIIGPLYTYLLGGLLWMLGTARALAAANALIEVCAVGIVFLAARRVSGSAGGIAAAVTYAAIPILVLSTRMLWNPSWLPALCVSGWWLVLRYTDAPRTSTAAAVGAVAGMTTAIHATGILHSAGWALAVLLSRPSLRHVSIAMLVGALPLTTLVMRAAVGRSDLAGAQSLVAIQGLNDVSSTLRGIGLLVAGFPIALADGLWSASLSSLVALASLVLACVGIIRGLALENRYRVVWVGVAGTMFLHFAAASVYTGYLSWYYFMALVGPGCLGLANLLPASSSNATRRFVAAGFTLAAVAHLAFVWQFDRRTIDAGYIAVDGRGLQLFNDGAVWHQRNSAVAHSIPIRQQRALAETLRLSFPGGNTAMRMSHGARAELWRATGAEYLPAEERPPSHWPWHFVLMGTGAHAVDGSAFVRDANICVFESTAEPRWRLREGRTPSGWDRPGFDDSQWSETALPRRTVSLAQAGPDTELATWASNAVRLRGTMNISSDVQPRLFAVVIHGRAVHSVAVGINGSTVQARRSRVLATDISRTEEWLYDFEPEWHPGSNLITVQVFGPSSTFDLDVFHLPCADSEWYY